MAHDTLPADEHDIPWKEAIEGAFPEFMAFYFPAAHADIDWRQRHVFLDKELQQVVRDVGRRFAAKRELVRLLYAQGWERQRVIDLFAIIDWVLQLPKPMEQQVWQDLETIEGKADMKYVTSVERLAIERSRLAPALSWCRCRIRRTSSASSSTPAPSAGPTDSNYPPMACMNQCKCPGTREQQWPRSKGTP